VERIAVAFENEATCRRVCDMIESSGIAGCVSMHSCGEVKRTINKARINIVVCGYKLSDDSAESLFEDLPPTCSMLMVATQGQLDMVHEDIFRLPAPISRSSLIASVQMLMQMNRRLSKYVKPHRNSQDQQVVEEAKRLLMERHGMTEEQAHRFIQKRSMDSGARMVQTAQMILGEVVL
jgi:response regulator NasT